MRIVVWELFMEVSIKGVVALIRPCYLQYRNTVSVPKPGVAQTPQITPVPVCKLLICRLSPETLKTTHHGETARLSQAPNTLRRSSSDSASSGLKSMRRLFPFDRHLRC
jgi:hypothetical protein